MSLSPEKTARCNEAVAALRALRDEYSDVLVVLDYVVLDDIATYQSADDDKLAGDVLSEEELNAVLWHVGKHIGGASQDILPALVEFALLDHVRRNLDK